LEDFLINSFNAVRLTRREFTSSEIAFTNDGFIPHEFSADFMVWFPIGLIITGLSSLEPFISGAAFDISVFKTEPKTWRNRRFPNSYTVNRSYTYIHQQVVFPLLSAANFTNLLESNAVKHTSWRKSSSSNNVINKRPFLLLCGISCSATIVYITGLGISCTLGSTARPWITVLRRRTSLVQAGCREVKIFIEIRERLQSSYSHINHFLYFNTYSELLPLTHFI